MYRRCYSYRRIASVQQTAGVVTEWNSPPLIQDDHLTAILANNAVFYGCMVLQGILELIAAEGEGVGSGDVSIAGAPFYEQQGDAISVRGFAFSGGSEYGVFQLVATLTVEAGEAGDQVAVVFGRDALFDGLRNPLEPPTAPAELKHRDLTANDLANASCPYLLKLDAEALPLVSWVIYSLFVEYRVSAEALEEDYCA